MAPQVYYEHWCSESQMGAFHSISKSPKPSGTYTVLRGLKGIMLDPFIHSQKTSPVDESDIFPVFQKQIYSKPLLLATLHHHPWTKLVHFHFLFPLRWNLDSICKMDSEDVPSDACVWGQTQFRLPSWGSLSHKEEFNNHHKNEMDKIWLVGASLVV